MSTQLSNSKNTLSRATSALQRKYRSLSILWQVSIPIAALLFLSGAAYGFRPIRSTVVETVSIPFETKYEDDASKFVDYQNVLTEGINGEKSVEYAITKNAGLITSKTVVKEKTLREPKQKVITRGLLTKGSSQETVNIPFSTQEVPDPSKPSGAVQVTTQGQNGSKIIYFDDVFLRGERIQHVQASEKITKQPVMEVKSVGTLVQSSCSPHYYGCVPIAADVDCANGSGNGPAYVAGPVYVKDYDIYGLDRNGDGVGCE